MVDGLGWIILAGVAVITITLGIVELFENRNEKQLQYTSTSRSHSCSSPGNRCLICSELISILDHRYRPMLLSCGHLFHAECIDERLRNGLSCPIC